MKDGQTSATAYGKSAARAGAPLLTAKFPALPSTLVLSPESRNPIRLPEETVKAVLERRLPSRSHKDGESLHPSAGKLASVVVVTYNNLVLNRLCLESLLVNTAYPDYEVIVVDNGSTDGTSEYLRALCQQSPRLRALFNPRNLGFAPANNQGLAAARGDVLVLLNNDTIVPPSWLCGLAGHLEDLTVGALGPVTNRIGNEAQIEAEYITYGELLKFAVQCASEHAGELFDVRMLAMYCFAMRREVFEQIGPLDERYEVGTLEDDDYSMRLHRGGYRTVCAGDVFVHHFGKASFGNLIPKGEYHRILEKNRRRFEEKWGIAWQPYKRRRGPRYRALVRRICDTVDTTLPQCAKVLVVSKGDEELLALKGRTGWHFPQQEAGVYSGWYPANSEEAIVQLETLRASGAEYLLFPTTAFWWFDHYAEFAAHLQRHYRIVFRDPDSCLILSLVPQHPGASVPHQEETNRPTAVKR